MSSDRVKAPVTLPHGCDKGHPPSAGRICPPRGSDDEDFPSGTRVSHSTPDQRTGPRRGWNADQTIRVSLNPVIYNNLPLLMAADKGYFAQQHLNVVITPINQSAATIIPLLARGDIDMAQVVTAPAFFNAFSEGFNLKVVASV